MRQLNVRLTERQHETLRRHAARRRTPIAWLIKDFVESLAARDADEAVRSHEATQLAARGGSFDWLRDEPDIYGEHDGEPTDRPKRRRR